MVKELWPLWLLGVTKATCACTLLLPPTEIFTYQQPGAFIIKPNYVYFLIFLSSSMMKDYITKESYFPVKIRLSVLERLKGK